MGGTNPQKRAICYVGLCTPHPHILSFYEERMQRRIKEEVSSLKSPPGGSFPHSHFVTFPLVYHKTSSKKGGSVTACGYCGGAAPRGYLRGSPLDTLLLTFLVKEKSVPVWAAQAHRTKSLMKLSLEEEAEMFYTLLRSFVSLPLRISTSSILHWGSREGATPSLCRRSRNQKVPCVSLPTFFTQESRCGCGVRNPTKQKV